MHMKTYLSHFEKHLHDQNKSLNTIAAYMSDLNHYFSNFPTINRENIISYKKLISNFTSTTINRKLSSIKAYNEYLLSIGKINSVYILKTDFIKIQNKGNPTTVSNEQVVKFLQRVCTTNHTYKSRNVAIIYLIANTDIRREECTNIKLKNLDLDNGELIIIGKGNKERTVILNKISIKVLKDYLVDRAKSKFAHSPYLFVSERAPKLNKNTINEIFELYCTPRLKIHPHQLRHNFATNIIENGILSLPELQNQLGHSNIATTNIYTHARMSRIKDKINQLCII